MQKRIFLSPPWMGGNERALVDEAFASGYIAPCGPMVDRFERNFALAVGMPYVCAVSSGTAALELLFNELGVGSGDLIFCSDLTFISSIAPAVHRGAIPVFIDCDVATWNMDPVLLEEALINAERQGALPKAVVAVDLYGQCCDYERIEALCAYYGVPLIIDAAEAFGAVYDGGDGAKRPAGNAGWAAVYSFNGNKIITTSGGGMLASHDEGAMIRARKLSQQAREPMRWYEHHELGYNHRMSNLVAAVGVGQLGYLDTIIARKRQIFNWYNTRLSDIEGFSFMPEAAYGQCTRWLTVAQIKKSGVQEKKATLDIQPSGLINRVMDALEKQNIEARPVWKPMHLQPVFQGSKKYNGGISERLFANGLCLPSGVGLQEAEVERVCGIIREALRES